MGRCGQPVPHIVISTRGGVVQEIYSDCQVEAVLVDWDEEHPEAGRFKVDSIDMLPKDSDLGRLIFGEADVLKSD